MVQKIHPLGVIWGAIFPPPVVIFSKKNQLSVLSIYIVVLDWVHTLVSYYTTYILYYILTGSMVQYKFVG